MGRVVPARVGAVQPLVQFGSGLPRRPRAEAGAEVPHVLGQPIHPDYVSRHFVRLVRHANELKVGSMGKAVMDVQQRLGVEPSGGMLRIGLVHYNTSEEVDRALEALNELGR